VTTLDERVGAELPKLVRRFVPQLKAIYAAELRRVALVLAPPAPREAMKVTLPNGIVIHPENETEMEALLAWLTAAPGAVLGGPSELTKPAKVGSGSPIREVVPKTKQPSESETGSEERNKPAADSDTHPQRRGRPPRKDLTGVKVGTYVGVEPTGERTENNSVIWLFHCPTCHAERRWQTGAVSTKLHELALGRTPKCLCTGGMRRQRGADGELEPRKEPPPVLSSAPTIATPARAKASRVGSSYQQTDARAPKGTHLSGFTTLVGLVFGTWLVLERAPSAGANTRWKCRCTRCGATKEHFGFGLRRKAPDCLACRRGAPALTGADDIGPSGPVQVPPAPPSEPGPDVELDGPPTPRGGSDIDEDLLDRAMAEMADDKRALGWGDATRSVTSDPALERAREEREDEDDDQAEAADG